MSEKSGSTPDPDGGDEQAAVGKQIEKVKADNEKIPEKLKPEKEFKERKEFKEHKELNKEFKEFKSEKDKDEKEFKDEKELKDEKEFKNEKIEKFENKAENRVEKNDKLEGKDIKSEKPEKEDFKENKREKEGEKEPFEKPPGREGRPGPEDFETLPIERESLAKHADALEAAARQLRHFIEASERPDLSRGALKNEPDEEDGEST